MGPFNMQIQEGSAFDVLHIRQMSKAHFHLNRKNGSVRRKSPNVRPLQSIKLQTRRKFVWCLDCNLVNKSGGKITNFHFQKKKERNSGLLHSYHYQYPSSIFMPVSTLFNIKSHLKQRYINNREQFVNKDLIQACQSVCCDKVHVTALLTVPLY